MKRIYYGILALVFCALNVNAQVKIGTNTDPHEGAVLDMKSEDTEDKGVLFPNVNLRNADEFQLEGDQTEGVGMVVYNTNSALGVGLYAWDGEQWTTYNPGSNGNSSGGNFTGDLVEEVKVEKIGNGYYKTYTYNHIDGTAATWMVQNSTEGTAVYNYENLNILSTGFGYTYANAASACPSGWSLPTRQDYQKLFTWISMNRNALGAQYWINASYGALSYQNTTLTTETFLINTWYDGGRIIINAGSITIDAQTGVYAYTVRCIKN